MRKIKFAENNSTLNIDAVDGVLDTRALFRVLHNTEPRLMRDIMVKDIEINAEVLNKEAEKIELGLNSYGFVQNKDFLRTDYWCGKQEMVITFYGEGFCLSIAHYDYMNNSTFNFCAALGYDTHEHAAFRNIISSFERRIGKEIEKHKSKIYVINKTENGLNLVNFPIRKNTSKNQGIKFEDLYNDDFFEKSDRIINFLSTPAEERDNNGIIVLQGIYGTGKTNYLRHIIRNLNKKIIFLPPELAIELANPGFVTFLMEHANNAVLIIEDSETVLKTREAGGNQAVANLLNMSDGILGDALALQIICTLNAEQENIDKALLREGRLVEIYEFKPLCKEKTENLFRKLYGEDAIPPKEEMTLSQIFKCEDFVRNEKERPVKKAIGFT